MNKIRSIKQLEAEKKRIKQQREKLEDKLRSEWNELKDCLKPVNIAKDTLGSILKNRTESNFEDEHILKTSFTYGVSLLAGRVADKTGKKLNSFFKRQ